MFQLLLSRTCTKSKTLQLFSPHHHCGDWGTQQVGRRHSQGSRPKPAKRMLQIIWCHAQYINHGKSWPRACWPAAWEWAGHQLVDDGKLHCTSLVLYILLVLSLFPFIFCPRKPFLSQAVSLTFFPFQFSPQLTEGWKNEWVAEHCLAACWITPGHKRMEMAGILKSHG